MHKSLNPLLCQKRIEYNKDEVKNKKNLKNSINVNMIKEKLNLIIISIITTQPPSRTAQPMRSQQRQP